MWPLRRGRDRAPGGREDHLDDRDVVALAGVAEHRRAGRVAGDDERLHAQGDEVVEALEGVLADLADRLGAVGLAGGVAEVEHRLVRQLVDHRPSHGEPAETGVEDADGGIHPAVGRPVLLHDGKARGWLAPRGGRRDRDHGRLRRSPRTLLSHACPPLRALGGPRLGADRRLARSCRAASGAAHRRDRANQVTRVVVISVDGLNPDAITQLGRPARRPSTGSSTRVRPRSTPAARSR